MSGHQHLLAKDPTRLGWKCTAAGCGFFKPAEEFDGIAVLMGQGEQPCRNGLQSNHGRTCTPEPSVPRR
jgi:hypothetical protein